MRFKPGSFVRVLAVATALAAPGFAVAQDAARGARLYLQLPGAASCVSCHGPDPSQGRNNLLLAADYPRGLYKALNTVAAMGYLKSLLSDADVADLAAYLGRVAFVQAPGAPIALWPTTIEFGSLALGSASPVQEVELRNLRAEALALASPRIDGPGAGAFTLDSDCPASLAPSASCSVRLRAQPPLAGPAAATLVLQEGVATPWVTGVSVTAQPGAVGVLSTDLPAAALDFAALAIGESSLREFRLVSHGTAPATLGVLTLTGPERSAYQLQGGCVQGLVLVPGTSCTMRLRFAPVGTGEARATLQWRSDASNPGSLKLSGVGRAAVTTPPPAAPTPTPSPPPAAEPTGGGGGCAAAPPARRADPLIPLVALLAAAALWLRARRGSVMSGHSACHVNVT